MKRLGLTRGRRAALPLGLLVAAVLLAVAGVNPVRSQNPLLVAPAASGKVSTTNLYSSVWDQAPSVDVTLSMQNVTNPMGGGEVATVRARALHDGKRLYILLEWGDSTRDLTLGLTQYGDAAAVEFPRTPGKTVPSFCMGDVAPDRGVNIWQWRAVWQEDIATKQASASIQALHPDMQVDLYPFRNDPVYMTARDVNNLVSIPARTTPIDNLVANQFGTLTDAPQQDVHGLGEWRDGRWRVLLYRDMTQPAGMPSLSPGTTTNVALAVWDGARGNRDGMKSVSSFLDLQIAARTAGGGGLHWGAGQTLALLIGMFGAATVGLFVLIYAVVRPPER